MVVFALPDGVQRRLQLTEESTAPSYEVDEAVTIAYDPERPDHARIKTSASTAAMWILPLIMVILGGLSWARRCSPVGFSGQVMNRRDFHDAPSRLKESSLSSTRSQRSAETSFKLR